MPNGSSTGEMMKAIEMLKFLRQSVVVSLLLGSCIGELHGESFKVRVSDYPTNGNPTSAISTADGKYLFVSVTNVGSPNFTGPDSVAGARHDVVCGIQVFRVHNERLNAVGFIRLGSAGANGLAILRGGKTLVVGVGDEGVAFLSISDVLKGTARPTFADQGEKAGTFDVVATPDGQYVFSSNEYGMFHEQRGNVGVTATHMDESGAVTHPETIGHIAVGDVVPSLAISPDGSRIYVATELVSEKNSPPIAGAANPALTKRDCVQKKGTPPRGNGFVSVLDVRRAIALKEDAILARVASGCSPVRLVETQDQSELFVSARGDNAVLAFNTLLLESDPEHAFQRALPSGGDAPVGIRLFAHDHLLAVANSNRFAAAEGTGAILELTKGSEPVKTWTAGTFPRNISLGVDGETLFLTNYTSRSVEVVRVPRTEQNDPKPVHP